MIKNHQKSTVRRVVVCFHKMSIGKQYKQTRISNKLCFLYVCICVYSKVVLLILSIDLITTLLYEINVIFLIILIKSFTTITHLKICFFFSNNNTTLNQRDILI